MASSGAVEAIGGADDTPGELPSWSITSSWPSPLVGWSIASSSSESVKVEVGGQTRRFRLLPFEAPACFC